MEKFLFNHTIIIDSILNRLQSSVEVAYLRKENFVDLIYTAFEDCQRSMYQLITGGKYARPSWLTLTDEKTEPHRVDNICSQLQENMKTCKKQDSMQNAKLKFLNDFSEILTKFDTKDTNL